VPSRRTPDEQRSDGGRHDDDRLETSQDECDDRTPVKEVVDPFDDAPGLRAFDAPTRQSGRPASDAWREEEPDGDCE